jgi:hypothetical protein
MIDWLWLIPAAFGGVVVGVAGLYITILIAVHRGP